MSRMSRRTALTAGGALGALGALTVTSPASARPLWTWSPAGSVAGSGTGADPRWVWDDEADELVASLLDRGVVPRVNELLRTWTKNGQPLPEGLPSDLRDFVEDARRLPSWANEETLATAFEFNEQRGFYVGLLYGFASGMMATAIPKEARAVYYSKGGADMKGRISRTAKLGYDIMSKDTYADAGEMVVTCVKTRLVHAAVRHLLPQSPHWDEAAGEDIPISQADMMVTWHSLPTTVMRKLDDWNVPIDPAHSDAFLHSWQLSAHMLGVADEYIPNSWAQADDQAKQVLDPILEPTEEGIKLADILLGLGDDLDKQVLSRPVLGAFSRHTLGDEIADWLQIPREPVWDPVFATSWDPFVAAREGLATFPGSDKIYWTLDEFIRQFFLLYLSEAKPISIEIPTANRPY